MVIFNSYVSLPEGRFCPEDGGIQPMLRNPALMVPWNSLCLISVWLWGLRDSTKKKICWFLSEAADDMGQNLIAPKMDGKCNEPTDYNVRPPSYKLVYKP